MAKNQDEVVGVNPASLPADLREVLAERAAKTIQVAEELPPDSTDLTSTDRTRTVVYSTLTGDPHEILTIDRPRALRMTRTDGKPSFWAPGMPGGAPVRHVGALKCFLAPESSERNIVDAAGYAGKFCNDGDPSQKNREDFQAISHKEAHEARKHPGAWAAVKRFKELAHEAEVMQLQREQLEAMRAIAAQAAEGPRTN